MGGVIQALRLLLLLNGLNEIDTNWERKTNWLFYRLILQKKDALENMNLYVLVS